MTQSPQRWPLISTTRRRHVTAREDTGRHRAANDDWDDAWVFSDPRFQLADRPDQVLLDFLAYMAHPVVQPDTGKAMGLVTRLNSLLSPDGWELRATKLVIVRTVPFGAVSAGRADAAPCYLRKRDSHR